MVLGHLDLRDHGGIRYQVSALPQRRRGGLLTDGVCSLLGNFFAYPSFQIKYGHKVPVTDQTPTGYSLTAGWQSGLQQAPGVGSIFGTILNGWLVAAYGPRKVLLCTLCVMTCFLFIVFFAPSKGVLLAGEFLLGFEWGIVSIDPRSASQNAQLTLHVVRHDRAGLRL